ncbi:MAG: hypothetical protein GOMPHAMPRED_007011 [Gomphillus americanus]|uniref:Uncharacterized protein n=1 Tax=Gomphillus americanus TaxID=1940652 RepID=A0A8H3EWP9_9LECA|nr:MAG: hypothetical protein GOMPHAMPRED_007011 [Gomphillus americanus]
MQAVRRLSLPFVQPLARLFNHEELDSVHRESLPPPPENPATTTPPASSNLNQVVSHPTTVISTTDADLPLLLQDAVYIYQLSHPSPLKLSPLAFHTADIVWRYKDSERVYNILQKRGIITPQGGIRTAAISNKFAHQFAFLSAFAQRRIIGLLFWWEEEEQRLKHLYQQGDDIFEALNGMEESQDRAMFNMLQIELERVKMLIKQKPSIRCSDTASARKHEQLPAYAPPPPGSSREQLPMFTEDPATFVAG